eukprot:8434878-Lingulodinium_polyedra.AAC.1
MPAPRPLCDSARASKTAANSGRGGAPRGSSCAHRSTSASHACSSRLRPSKASEARSAVIPKTRAPDLP